MSFQKQEPENGYNGGETIWFDLSDPRAKNMLTWRLGVNSAARTIVPAGTTPTDAQMQRIVWAGAHYYGQDQVDYNNPTDVHGHWSIEVPTTEPGLPLRTRFEVLFADPADKKIGLEKTIIRTTLADFVVRADPAKGGVLRLTGLKQKPKVIEFSEDDAGYSEATRRWQIRLVADSETANGDLRIRRYDDAGAPTTHLHLDRLTGNSTFDFQGQHGAPVAARWDGAAGYHGFLVKPDNNLGPGNLGAYASILNDVADKLILSNVVSAGVADTTPRFVIRADGSIKWGTGSAGRDITLARVAAGRLSTDEFQASRNLRLGTGTSLGGGVGVMAIQDVITAPTTNPGSGVIFYSQGGVLKVCTPAGVFTVNTTAAA